MATCALNDLTYVPQSCGIAIPSRAMKCDVTPEKTPWDRASGQLRLQLQKIHKEIFDTPGSTPLPSARHEASNDPTPSPLSARKWGPLHDCVVGAAVPKLKFTIPGSDPRLVNSPGSGDESPVSELDTDIEPDPEEIISCRGTPRLALYPMLAHCDHEPEAERPLEESAQDDVMQCYVEPFVQKEIDPVRSCEISPRAHAALTCDGKAFDGLGILEKLEAEIRRRAHDLWSSTGNSSAQENWLAAERSLLTISEVIPTYDRKFSPRTHSVLTCDGKARDGAGILARLEAEIRRRAQDQWANTGNPSPEENWLAAERSVLKACNEPTLLQSLHAKDVELKAQAARIRELESSLQTR